MKLKNNVQLYGNLSKIFLISSLFFTFNYAAKSQILREDFSNGYNGWAGDFADYPLTDSVFYELDWKRENLPSPLNTKEYALKIRGNNHSDDLFMFIKKKFSGLKPNTDYWIIMNVTFASNAPTNAIGIGGPPGESVFVKAGSSLIEPKKIIESGYFRMNIDKGNQSQPGKDMENIGHVGISDTTTVYTLKTLSNSEKPFYIKTGSTGEIWICIGTDSGFEGTTTIFFDKIKLEFQEFPTGFHDIEIPDLKIYPNPAYNMINITTKNKNSIDIEILNQQGYTVKTLTVGDSDFLLSLYDLSSGLYYLRNKFDKGKAIRLIKQ